MFNFMYIFEISYLEFIKKNFNFKKTHPIEQCVVCYSTYSLWKIRPYYSSFEFAALEDQFSNASIVYRVYALSTDLLKSRCGMFYEQKLRLWPETTYFQKFYRS